MQGRVSTTIPWLLQAIKLDTDDCIPWPFAKDDNGYGKIWFMGVLCLASRVALHLHNGFDLGSPLEAMHTCDNPPCINPRHLIPGTHKQNFLDASKKGRLHRTICDRGHELSENNTYVSPKGVRACIKCKNRSRYGASYNPRRAVKLPESTINALREALASIKKGLDHGVH
jgi:hypothetical protein